MLPAVIDQIKPLGQLHTASYFLSTVVDTQMKIGALQQLQRVLLVACGKVDGGVDLAKLQPSDIQTLRRSVIIRLPAPEVFTTQLFDDRKCTYVVMRDEGVLLPPNLVLETAAREAAVATSARPPGQRHSRSGPRNAEGETAPLAGPGELSRCAVRSVMQLTQYCVMRIRLVTQLRNHAVTLHVGARTYGANHPSISAATSSGGPRPIRSITAA